MDRGSARTAAVVAGVITLGCGGFAVAMAATSDDDDPAVVSDATTGTGGTTVPAAAGVPVAIAGFAFDPTPVVVPAGGAVTWTNNDGLAHSIRTADGAVASPELDQGASFTATFATPGEVAYFCGIHESMQGTVTVEP